jgi:hypothetical protein
LTDDKYHAMSLSITTAFLLLSLFILGAIFFIINYSAHIHTYAQFQNNMSSLSLSGVNITSPQRGQQIPVNVNDLNIAGKSTDKPNANDCQVSVIVNGIKPYQSATADGSTGTKNDYSRWFFLLGSNYTSIKEGTNEITAKLSCLSNSLSNNNNTTKWYSINVTGVTASNNITIPTQSSPVINPGTQGEPNIDELQNPAEEQEKSLFGASDENAEKVIKEEIKNFRERIMEEVEDGLKEQGIELNLP